MRNRIKSKGNRAFTTRLTTTVETTVYNKKVEHLQNNLQKLEDKFSKMCNYAGS